ncbi:hypothetical protein ACLOJK_020649 [Asimina triloba]
MGVGWPVKMRMVGTVAARLWTLDRWAIDAGQRRMVLNVGWGVAGSWDRDGAVADGDGRMGKMGGDGAMEEAVVHLLQMGLLADAGYGWAVAEDGKMSHGCCWRGRRWVLVEEDGELLAAGRVEIGRRSSDGRTVELGTCSDLRFVWALLAVDGLLDHGERKWGLLMGLIGEDDGAPYWCSVLWRSTADCVPAMYKFII